MQILCLSKIAIGSVSNKCESPQNKDRNILSDFR